jgi:hypothetical protein
MSFSSDKYLKKYSGLVEEIKHLTVLFDAALDYKEIMKELDLSIAQQSHILGSLFVEHNVLTTEQASALKATMTKEQSMWDVYSNVSEVLLKSHCKDWIRNQSLVNYYFSNTIEIISDKLINDISEHLEIIEAYDPLEDNYGQPENQTNILTQIAELEASDEEYAQLADEIALNNPLITEDFTVMSTDGTEFKFEMNPDGTIKSLSFTDEPIDEVIHYTDPAGNTFETISTEAITSPSLEPTPEEYVLFEEEIANDMAINDDFDFTFSDNEEETDTTDDFIL